MTSDVGTTRAVGAVRFGGPDVLEVVERPMREPGLGEVVVRVLAATVNPTDTLLRSGAKSGAVLAPGPPYVPGMEFAGHVHKVGSGPMRHEVGDLVMGIVSPYRVEGGAQVQHLRVSAASVVPVPAGIDAVAAATIPMNGLTARVALAQLALRSGQSVLVTGAAGGVGGYVLELASNAGLRVVAVAAESDADLVRDLGADLLVPRGAGLLGTVKDAFASGVDGVVDAALIGDEAEQLVADGGAYVALRTVPFASADDRIRRSSVSVLAHAADTGALTALGDLAAAGHLTPRVARTFRMDEASVAHRMIEAGGQRGRLVLRLDELDVP